MAALPQETHLATIERLRRTLRAIEKPALVGKETPLLAFGIPELDEALAGGLPCDALHEIAALHEAALAPAAGFALALAARHAVRKSVVFIAEDLSAAESGLPYGPGLDEIGLAPERLISVAAPKSRDVLWTMEEALRCSAIAAVIGELRAGERGIDTVATRRLSLAAAEHGTLALILRTDPGDEPSAAATRWMIGPAPTAFDQYGVGPPRVAAHLTRNRRGNLGSWILEWHRVEQRFILAEIGQPLAATAPDRPRRPARIASRVA